MTFTMSDDTSTTGAAASVSASPDGRVEPGSVAGAVRKLLRLEGAATLFAAALVYALAGYSWLLFAILFFAPDLSFVGYIAGPRAGAIAYNAFHSFAGPLVLASTFLLTEISPAVPLIWIAHIGFDRMLGYGLKYPSGFADTHLGAIGRTRDRSARMRVD